METLSPSLRLLQEIRYAVESGESVRTGLKRYLSGPSDDFSGKVRIWMDLLDRGCVTDAWRGSLESPSQRQILSLLEKGLGGQPVLPALVSLDEEFQELALHDLESHLASLPFKMMLPLLFFLFPAFLLLLLGPLVLGIQGGFA